MILFNPSIAFGQLKAYQDSLEFYFEKKNDEKILMCLDKILTLDPKSTYYLLSKGAFLHERKNYNEAIKLFSRVLEMNPSIKDAYVRRGISYLALQKYDSSILDATK